MEGRLADWLAFNLFRKTFSWLISAAVPAVTLTALLVKTWETQIPRKSTQRIPSFVISSPFNNSSDHYFNSSSCSTVAVVELVEEVVVLVVIDLQLYFTFFFKLAATKSTVLLVRRGGNQLILH